MAKLSPDRLPKGTTRDLSLLYFQLRRLSEVGVRIHPSHLKVLRRVQTFITANALEGPKC